MLSRNYTKGLLEYRAELMGTAAIGVLLTHSSGIVDWPSFFQPVVNYGGLGVYIFMFLSGIGMRFSLSSRNENVDIKRFYQRRWKKVFVPYLVIAGVWYCIKYLVIECDVGSFIFELSTLSYWIEHKGAWYVAALFPIYLIYPFFYRWADMGGYQKRTIKYMVSMACILALESVIYSINRDLYGHLAQVFNSIWIFILGSFFAPSLKKGKQSVLWIAPVYVVVFVTEKVLPLSMFCPSGGIIYALKGILMALVASIILTLFKSTIIHKPLAWLGGISLELYLTNIFCIQAVKYFSIDDFFQSYVGNGISGCVVYILVVVFGVSFSLMFHHLINRLLRKVS